MATVQKNNEAPIEMKIDQRPINIGEEISNIITDDVLAEFLTAPWGHKIGIYWGGNSQPLQASVGESVGSEIDPEERAFVTVECPGIGNVDMTWFRNTDGLDDEHYYDDMDDEDVILDCCENGDVSEYRHELVVALIDKIRENFGDRFSTFPSAGDVLAITDGNGGLIEFIGESEE